jgi:hypothetical protein
MSDIVKEYSELVYRTELNEALTRIEQLEAALLTIMDNAYNGEWTLPSTFGNCACAALDQSSPPKAST